MEHGLEPLLEARRERRGLCSGDIMRVWVAPVYGFFTQLFGLGVEVVLHFEAEPVVVGLLRVLVLGVAGTGEKGSEIVEEGFRGMVHV